MAGPGGRCSRPSNRTRTQARVRARPRSATASSGRCAEADGWAVRAGHVAQRPAPCSRADSAGPAGTTQPGQGPPSGPGRCRRARGCPGPGGPRRSAPGRRSCRPRERRAPRCASPPRPDRSPGRRPAARPPRDRRPEPASRGRPRRTRPRPRRCPSGPVAASAAVMTSWWADDATATGRLCAIRRAASVAPSMTGVPSRRYRSTTPSTIARSIASGGQVEVESIAHDPRPGRRVGPHDRGTIVGAPRRDRGHARTRVARRPTRSRNRRARRRDRR